MDSNVWLVLKRIFIMVERQVHNFTPRIKQQSKKWLKAVGTAPNIIFYQNLKIFSKYINISTKLEFIITVTHRFGLISYLLHLVLYTGNRKQFSEFLKKNEHGDCPKLIFIISIKQNHYNRPKTVKLIQESFKRNCLHPQVLTHNRKLFLSFPNPLNWS